jgi:galactokinase
LLSNRRHPRRGRMPIIETQARRGDMGNFEELFGRSPQVLASAPGRVNLIGEHTDYNGGFVLPAPIPQQTQVQLATRADDLVRAVSRSAGGGIVSYRLGQETPGRGWLDYLQGVTQALARRDLAFCGFDVRIESDVPLGSGLSSSASLSISLLRALRTAFALQLDDVQTALVAQEAENRFVGAQVGIMDPMACHLCQDGGALFLDAHTLHYESVPLPAGAELVVLHSGVAHRHAAGDYNSRRAECQRACELLGVRQLRDLGLEDLSRLTTLPAPLDRRARHVITENARVLAAVERLHAGDLVGVGRLFYESHVSQREDYEVSVPETDLLVELARHEPDVYGARLTGGGFGGSVVLLVRAGRGAEVAQRVAHTYAERSGCRPLVLVPLSSTGQSA